MRVLDLFSGIGGFSLGLERAGMTTVAFCEIEEYPRRVLAKHWPHVPIFHDVRTLRGSDLEAINVICGGFPCQDISTAGKGAGLAGKRSGLWSEYARIVGEIRPRYVIVENVAALLGRGLGTVLGDLAALGYDAEWHCIPASAVGAPHRRDRLWIVAYPAQLQRHGGKVHAGSCSEGGNAVSESRDGRPDADLADADRPRLEGWGINWQRASQRPAGPRVRSIPGEWLPEPDVGRVAHGVPARVDRLRGLGNAVVPQVVEIIGRAILAAESNA